MADEHSDIYQKPAPPQEPNAPLPSYDLPPEQARVKVRKQIVLLLSVIGLLVLLAVIVILAGEWSAEKPDYREGLKKPPAPPRTERTNQPAVVLQPATDLSDASIDVPTKPSPGISPERLAEAMGHVHVGREYLNAGDLTRAEEEARSALQIHPEMNAALRMLGMVYIQRGQFAQAIDVLEKSIKLDPFNPESYNNAATAYLQMRNVVRAEELLKTSLKIRPGYAVAQLNLGLLCILDARYEDALGYLQDALRQMPDNPALMNNIAVCHIRLGRYDDARTLLQELTTKAPSNVMAYFNLAVTYSFEENLEEAMRWIRAGGHALHARRVPHLSRESGLRPHPPAAGIRGLPAQPGARAGPDRTPGMKHEDWKKLLEQVAAGRLTVPAALDQLGAVAEHNLGFARLDKDRLHRRGMAEVIYCAGKTPEQVARIITAMKAAGHNILGTRASPAMFDEVSRTHRDAIYHPFARCITVDVSPRPAPIGLVVVATAGTSDLPVAEEAALTAEWMGARVERIFDVGVAGLHRLMPHLDVLRRARAVIAVAGMEGALPSVIGGLIARPLIAVPTSVGYGVNLGGLTALFAMLNSCAPGVSVVNVDNGFGAGVSAALINRIGEESSRPARKAATRTPPKRKKTK